MTERRTGVAKCAKCKQEVVLSAASMKNGKPYHVKCASDLEGKKRLYDYLNEQAKNYINWATVTSQCKNFQKQYGYSYDELLLAARYQYEVLQPNGPRNTEHAKGIGLLPHIMEEALAYWKEDEARKAKILAQFEAMAPQKEIVIKAPAPAEKPKKFIDPLSILEKEEP